MEEIWKDIPGYEGLYQASTFGRFKSLPHVTICSNGKVRHCKEKIMKCSLLPNGYLHIVLRKNGKKINHCPHRLVLITFKGDRPGYDTNHIDENPQNNRLDNLEWLTRKENCNYGNRNKHISESKKGIDTAKCCDRKGTLNPNSVRVIALDYNRKVYKVYSCYREAAAALGISESTISRRARHLFKSNEYKGWFWFTENNISEKDFT